MNKKNKIRKELIATPMITQETYDLFPETITKIISNFDGRRKDMFTTGLLSLLGQVLIDVRSVYDDDDNYPVLYSLIVAPASSGKGSLKLLNDLSYKYRDYFKTNCSINNKTEFTPRFNMPVNTSYSALLNVLAANDGRGFFNAAEIDMLLNSAKQDWGIPSAALRQGWQHEGLEKLRVKEGVDIETPKFSLVLAGTVQQAINLIGSSENGLLSRFTPYIFTHNDYKARNPFKSKTSLNEKFKEEGEVLIKLNNFFKNRDISFIIPEEMAKEFVDNIDRNLVDGALENSQDSAANSFRQGLMMYRIMTIVGLVRCFDNNVLSNEIEFTDDDFKLSKKLMEVYTTHAGTLLNIISNNNVGVTGVAKIEALKYLNNEFTTEQYNKVCEDHYLFGSPTTMKRSLKRLREKGFVIQLCKGRYAKVA